MTDQTADFVGFGSAEIAYLRAQFESAAAASAAEALEIEGPTDDVLFAGASSLFARGLLQHDGDILAPINEAAVVSQAFNEGTAWVRLGFLSEGADTVDAAIMIHSDLDVLLQPRNLGSWVLVVPDPAVPTDRSLRRLIAAYLEANADGAVLVDGRGPGGEGTFFVRNSAHSDWQIARGGGALWSEAAPADSTDADLDGLIGAILSGSR